MMGPKELLLKNKKPISKGSYWYKFYVGECPVCGRNASYKERVYGQKPQNHQERYEWLGYQSAYDGCMR